MHLPSLFYSFAYLSTYFILLLVRLLILVVSCISHRTSVTLAGIPPAWCTHVIDFKSFQCNTSLCNIMYGCNNVSVPK